MESERLPDIQPFLEMQVCWKRPPVSSKSCLWQCRWHHGLRKESLCLWSRSKTHSQFCWQETLVWHPTVWPRARFLDGGLSICSPVKWEWSYWHAGVWGGLGRSHLRDSGCSVTDALGLSAPLRSWLVGPKVYTSGRWPFKIKECKTQMLGIWMNVHLELEKKWQEITDVWKPTTTQTWSLDLSRCCRVRVGSWIVTTTPHSSQMLLTGRAVYGARGHVGTLSSLLNYPVNLKT